MIVVLFFTFVFVVSALRDEACKIDNEIFTGCGSECINCENYKNSPEICQEWCSVGCFCMKGFLRASDGKCVEPNNCYTISMKAVFVIFALVVAVSAQFTKQECQLEHEEFVTCGTACPITCANYNNPPTVCTLQCIIGCFCEKGYYRASDGSCVLKEDCF
ncbi:mucin-6-like [Centruroides sculpturatus]|uniref:mucin-6-like n=1 Tax=Centruroides sculpturatus TaxID=218467 RepID=UPI000C6D3D16|nr:mucin-6-like [Centruroides sculpturatus]